jgi:hypothetical protein
MGYKYFPDFKTHHSILIDTFLRNHPRPFMDAQNFCFDGPRINPRVGWTRARICEWGC